MVDNILFKKGNEYMKYRISILKKNYLLLILMAAMWLAGCVQEEFNIASPPTTENGVRFTLTVPDVGIPSVSSRTMSGVGAAKKEDEVKTVDILVFDTSKSPAVFLEWVEGTGVTQDLANNISTVDFSAILSPTVSSACIAIVANKQLGSIVSGFVKGTTSKAEVLKAITHTSTGEWPADGLTPDGYTPIPMYGEKEVTKLGPSMEPITGISMTRMLARIDIRNSASNFTVEEVYLANYNTTGYVAPAWDANGQIIVSAADDALNIPANSGKQTQESLILSYSVDGNTPYDGEIYTFEAPAAVDAGSASQDGAASRKEAVCLIVKGKIDNGESTFYRVDFTKTGEVGEQVEYLPLKRNYKYIVSITKALGAGYESIGDALNSYTVMSNLKIRLIHYNRDKVKDVVYNGQYMLGVGESEVGVTQYQNNSYAIDIFTDSPDGWKASVTEGSDWLGFGDGAATASGIANDDTQLMLRIPYFNDGTVGITRTATVTLTAGRLTHEIKVIQKVIDPGIIKFVDAYGNVLENGLFFPIRNPDGDDLPIEPQTVYAMFSMDKINVYLQETANVGTVQYAAGGLIPELERGNSKTFRDRVQAFTVQPNPRREGDGSTVNGDGWWWRQDYIKFNLFDKEGYLAQVQFPINQGELEFSIRFYPTTANSRTYKMYLGAEQYVQLFVNNNWEIMEIEELDIVGDDGTGLIRPDADNDIIVGTKNADPKMYQQSVVSASDDGKGNDVVNRGYDFRLKLHPGKWKEGKSGTIRITFRNVMHTVSDSYYPFYRTIDLQMVSEVKSYTSVGQPLFYLYPLRFDNRKYYTEDANRGRQANATDAETICKNIGDGWRLPTASELLMSYVYENALGGNALDDSYYNSQNIYGWYHNWTGNYWSSSYYTAAGSATRFSLELSTGFPYSEPASDNKYFRCVRDNSKSGTKYPYLIKSTEGVTVVSRDANGGADSSVLLSSGESPATTNKVAPKFQIENTSSTGKTWEQARDICAGKGNNWRLPTQREMYLALSLGASVLSNNNQGFGSSTTWTGNGFQEISGVHWTLTDRDGNYWLVGENSAVFGAWPQDGEATWARYRCVRTVE